MDSFNTLWRTLLSVISAVRLPYATVPATVAIIAVTPWVAPDKTIRAVKKGPALLRQALFCSQMRLAQLKGYRYFRTIFIHPNARVAEWQTRQVEGLVPIFGCGGSSPPPCTRLDPYDFKRAIHGKTFRFNKLVRRRSFTCFGREDATKHGRRKPKAIAR